MEAVNNANSLSGNNIITQKFIERVLGDEAKNIVEAQNRVLSSKNPKSKDLIISSRTYQVSQGSLEFTHAKQQRFIDMKRLGGRKKKAVPVHNKPLFGHFNNIIAELKFGFTDSVQSLIANEYNINM